MEKLSNSVLVDRIAKAIDEKAEKLADRVLRTPLIRLPWLDKPGRIVWGKLENLQVGGSFKFRGALSALMDLEGRRFVAASAGNHAIALARAAEQLGKKGTIFVPTNASELKITRLRSFDLELVVAGSDVNEAQELGRKYADSKGIPYISSYSNFDVIVGQGSLGPELSSADIEFDHLIVPMGGGGLLVGIASHFSKVSPTTKVHGIQPRNFNRARLGGLELADIGQEVLPSIADGLSIKVGTNEIVYGALLELAPQLTEVEEEHIYAAIYAILYREGLLVEGAGAIGVAAMLEPGPLNNLNGNVCILLSGGNISVSKVSQVLQWDFEDDSIKKLCGLKSTKSLFEAPVKVAQEITKNIENIELDNLHSWNPIFRRVEEQITGLEITYEKFKRFIELNGLKSNPVLIAHVDAELTALKTELKVLIETNPNQPANQYRMILLRHANLFGLLNWCSSSYDQSEIIQFFNPSVQQNDGVNYSRYGSNEVKALELNLEEIFSLQGRGKSLLVTSSGMAAYGLIEAFLLRNVLVMGDVILKAPYIYFEVDEQISSLKNYKVVSASSYTVESLAKQIDLLKPKVVFLDPMANKCGMPTIDLRDLAKEALLHDWHDIYFVIDGTMVSAGMEVFEWFADKKHPQIMLYESASKYLQLGMDTQMAGVCIFDHCHFEKMSRLRRNLGSILYDYNAVKFPKYSREEFGNHMRAITSNVEFLINYLEAVPGLGSKATIGFPKNWRGLGWTHAGGVVTFEFIDKGLNNKHMLDGLILRIIAKAQANGTFLTRGVSFGFNHARISAASAMAESEPPFLRLSVGLESRDEMEKLARCVAEGILEHGARVKYA